MTEIIKVEDQLPVVFDNDKPTIRQIRSFIEYMKSRPDDMGKDPFPLETKLEDGFYYRTISIPKGYCVAGTIHLTDSFVMLKKGRVMVAAEGEAKLLEAPCMFVSGKGKQKIAYVLEDIVWTDIYRTDAKTEEEAYEELFTEDYARLDRDDYQYALEDIGMSDEEAKRLTESDYDELTENPMLELRESPIHGKGVFSKVEFMAGKTIDLARVATTNKRTISGRYVNHSANPNSVVKSTGSVVYFVANVNIQPGDEITVDYRQARHEALKADEFCGR